jgi:hypothetical protein
MKHIASKNRISQVTGNLTYYHTKNNDITTINEDSNLCDGIGGILWDGSLIMSYLLEEIVSNVDEGTHFIELGCGTGLCSIVASKSNRISRNIKFSATDRYIDLLDINIENNNLKDEITSDTLNWDNPNESNICNNKNNSDKYQIIYGVEIACLINQQHKLINTINKLYNDNSIILITFDDTPSQQSNYEKQFIKIMQKENFVCSVIFTGSIEWDSNKKDAYITDLTNKFHNDLNKLAFPIQCKTNYGINIMNDKIDESKIDSKNDDKIPPIPSIDSHQRQNLHHVMAFYKVKSLLTCKNCHKSYVPFMGDKCLTHSGLFVCRWHPSETKLNINGLGDGEGYYGGKEDYEAKFWDCCGIEDRNAIGCKYNYHQSYS